jgi:hypothetical protein
LAIATDNTTCSIGNIDILSVVEITHTKEENGRVTVKIEALGSQTTGMLCNLIDSIVKLVIENKEHSFVLHGEYSLNYVLPTIKLNDVIYTTIYLSK